MCDEFSPHPTADAPFAVLTLENVGTSPLAPPVPIIVWTPRFDKSIVECVSLFPYNVHTAKRAQ